MKYSAALAALLLATPALAQNAPMQLQPPRGTQFSPSAPASPRPGPSRAAPTPPVDAVTAIEKANAFFNGAGTMIGNFVQVGADGHRNEGKLYVQRPGRMRFEYAKPATLEIIADGTSVAVRDRKLATQDLYLIGQTPLKFLLKERIDLARDTKVLGVSGDANAVSINIEDKATFGGTSRIRLSFDPATFMLKQWRVTDPQGYETQVSLFDLDLATKPNAALFRIDQERILNPK